MSNSAEREASISTIPYRNDLAVGGDCGISYFVDNQFGQSILGIQNGSSANHQGLGISNANAGVGSERQGYILP
jgi:hypothetical protein